MLGITTVVVLAALGLASPANATATQTATLTGPSAAESFGATLSTSGDTVLVGAPRAYNSEGRAYIDTEGAGGWTRSKQLKALDAHKGAQFGHAVALEGTTAVVGAPYQKHVGAAYIFSETGPSTWTQTAELSAVDGAKYDGFGISVAISGSAVLIGAAAGAAYVFTDGAGGWTESAGLSVPGTNSFGYTVALDGTTAIVGAGEGEGAYVFTDGAGGWTESANLSCGEVCYVVSLALTGSTAVLGGFNGWSVVIYDNSASGWAEEGYLGAPVAGFGTSVAISGSNIVVGATDQKKHGNAYVYSDEQAGWVQTAAINAPKGNRYDTFGTAVAIAGSTAFVSQPGGRGLVDVYSLM